MRHGLPLRAALAVGAFALHSVADPKPAATMAVPDNAAIAALIVREADETISLWRQNMAAIAKAEAAYSRARSQRRLRNTGVRSPSLDRAGAASAIELASAAIRTSLEGTEAGVSVAPAALLGAADSPHQPTLSLASLKDDKNRFAAAYNYQCGGDFQTPTELMLKTCTLGVKDEQKLRAQILQLSFAYKQACAAVHDVLVKPWGPALTPDALWVTEAVALCPGAKQQPETVVTFDVAGERLMTFFVNARASGDPADGDQLAAIIGPVQGYLEQLSAFKDPPPDCHEAKELTAALADRAWQEPAYRFGASYTFDTFAYVFGFNPKKDELLSKGRPARAEVKLEAARITGPFEVHLGAGYGRQREKLADDFRAYVAPSISLSFVLGSLSADALYKDGKLNLVDGKLPPRLVAGVNAELEYALDRPASQTTQVNKFAATAFVDFLFTRELGFRLGIPVKAQIVTRDADEKAVPKVTEKKSLQWSVPLFLTSAIKM